MKAAQKESFVQGKDVVERIEDEVQQHFQLTDVILADLSGDRPCKAPAIYFFILQRWSSKQSCQPDNIILQDEIKDFAGFRPFSAPFCRTPLNLNVLGGFKVLKQRLLSCMFI